MLTKRTRTRGGSGGGGGGAHNGASEVDAQAQWAVVQKSTAQAQERRAGHSRRHTGRSHHLNLFPTCLINVRCLRYIP